MNSVALRGVWSGRLYVSGGELRGLAHGAITRSNGPLSTSIARRVAGRLEGVFLREDDGNLSVSRGSPCQEEDLVAYIELFVKIHGHHQGSEHLWLCERAVAM